MPLECDEGDKSTYINGIRVNLIMNKDSVRAFSREKVTKLLNKVRTLSKPLQLSILKTLEALGHSVDAPSVSGRK